MGFDSHNPLVGLPFPAERRSDPFVNEYTRLDSMNTISRHLLANVWKNDCTIALRPQRSVFLNHTTTQKSNKVKGTRSMRKLKGR